MNTHTHSLSLSPSRLARLAHRSLAARLIATHVYPGFRTTTDVAGLIAGAGYTGPVEVAREGLDARL